MGKRLPTFRPAVRNALQGETTKLVLKSIQQDMTRMLKPIKDTAAQVRTRTQFLTFLGLLALKGELMLRVKNCQLSPVGDFGRVKICVQKILSWFL